MFLIQRLVASNLKKLYIPFYLQSTKINDLLFLLENPQDAYFFNITYNITHHIAIQIKTFLKITLLLYAGYIIRNFKSRNRRVLIIFQQRQTLN